jgi:hypothetical protein
MVSGPAAVTIPTRYCGPPASGNGGYSCGALAREFGQNPTEVSLLAPPPLDRPLALQLDVAQARMLDGDKVVAIARRSGEPDAGPVISAEQAARAAAEFDANQYAEQHAYPTCFTCGSGRTLGDGLRIWPGQTKEPGVVTWPWIPHQSTSDGSGIVDLAVVWAALDCPSGWSWLSNDDDLGPIVLGRLNAAIHRRPAVGEPVVVTGWKKEAAGRKRTAGSALRTAEGELLATGDATWVVLTDEQRAAFNAAT